MLTLILSGSLMTQVFLRRKASFEYRRGDQSQRHAEFHSVDNRPFAGSFLSGRIQDFINQIPSGFVFMPQDVGGDFDQVAA